MGLGSSVRIPNNSTRHVGPPLPSSEYVNPGTLFTRLSALERSFAALSSELDRRVASLTVECEELRALVKDLLERKKLAAAFDLETRRLLREKSLAELESRRQRKVEKLAEKARANTVFPWDQWLNGQQWVLVRGRDYGVDFSERQMRATIERVAKQRKLEVKIGSRIGVVTVQAVKPVE